jgi:hypothetical protein
MANVYAITNSVTGQRYIGSSLDDRLRGHQWTLAIGQCSSRALQTAWNEYGEEAFSFEILETVSDASQLRKREQFWIDSFDLATLYNKRRADNGAALRPSGKDDRIMVALRLYPAQLEALKRLLAKERTSAQKFIEDLIAAEFEKRGLPW